MQALDAGIMQIELYAYAEYKRTREDNKMADL